MMAHTKYVKETNYVAQLSDKQRAQLSALIAVLFPPVPTLNPFEANKHEEKVARQRLELRRAAGNVSDRGTELAVLKRSVALSNELPAPESKELTISKKFDPIAYFKHKEETEYQKLEIVVAAEFLAAAMLGKSYELREIAIHSYINQLSKPSIIHDQQMSVYSAAIELCDPKDCWTIILCATSMHNYSGNADDDRSDQIDKLALKKVIKDGNLKVQCEVAENTKNWEDNPLCIELREVLKKRITRDDILVPDVDYKIIKFASNKVLKDAVHSLPKREQLDFVIKYCPFILGEGDGEEFLPLAKSEKELFKLIHNMQAPVFYLVRQTENLFGMESVEGTSREKALEILENWVEIQSDPKLKIWIMEYLLAFRNGAEFAPDGSTKPAQPKPKRLTNTKKLEHKE